MKISIVGVSKTNVSYVVEAENDYRTRLQKFCQLDVVYLKEEPAKTANADLIKDKEGKRILENLQDDYYKIALVSSGKQYTSLAFASFLEEVRDFQGGKVVFIIGGPYGLSDKVVRICDMQVSLSLMTFPHQLVRIFLLEQIYRALQILAGSKYHK